MREGSKARRGECRVQAFFSKADKEEKHGSAGNKTEGCR